MAQFRKKLVVIEAVQWGPPLSENPEWMSVAFQAEAVEREGLRIKIRTLEGIMTANPGDWIIKGVDGELYPCKPDIFEKTYEAV